jgi:dephospho-CoA kinase
MLQELGASSIDADQVTHEIQQPGTHVYDQIVATFGSDILTEPGGPIDRRKLGALVFNDRSLMQRLEHIVHPAVHARIVLWLARGARSEEENQRPQTSPLRRVAVIDAIKLLEAGWKYHCDTIWVVTCTEEQQFERLVTIRHMNEEEARQRISSQPSQESRIAHADVIIDTSGTLAETRAQVERAWEPIGLKSK